MFDVVAFLEDNLIDFFLPGDKNVQEGWVGIRCPLCDDHSSHGGFNLNAGYYNCWRCGWHPIKKVITALGYPTVVMDSYQHSGLPRMSGKLMKRQPDRPLFISMPDGSKPLGEAHRLYLKRRGFDPELLVKKFKLQGTGPLGDYKHRIVAPIFYNGVFVSYQCRDISGKSKLRYKPCLQRRELIHHKDILYNIDTVEGQKALVVEGITDVWRLGDGCVATFGTTYTQSQVYLLAERCQKVYIMFDPEPTASKKAKSLATELSSLGVTTKVITLKTAGDPAASLTPTIAKRLKKEIGI